MGEVYRARDTKFQHDVVLKVLPDTMGRDAQRMARFEREVRTLGSLNDPNIAAIYGLEESNGIRSLVMELVGGELSRYQSGVPADLTRSFRRHCRFGGTAKRIRRYYMRIRRLVVSLWATVTCATLICAQSPSRPWNRGVLTGLDVLVQEDFAPLKGRNVGLITNQTGLSRDGRRNVDLMLAAGVKVHALFSPEHGFYGLEDRPNVANSVDPVTHLPIYSLQRGKQHRLTPGMLKGIDTLVFDIQDVGSRNYTYTCTMIYAMEQAAHRHIPFYVLDRPDPITGNHVEGPVIEKDLQSYVGCAAVPLRYGLTMGELAEFVNGTRQLGADLHVVRMKGWKRSDWWDETGLTWINPSPNMTSSPEALLYPGINLVGHMQNLSVGMGTRVPYQQVGADWLDARKLAAFLNARAIPGVRAYPVRFHPTAYQYAGKTINGVRFVVTDRDRFNSVLLSLEIIHALEKLYPGKINLNVNEKRIGSRSVIEALKSGKAPAVIERSYQPDLQHFMQSRRKYLLY